MYCVPDIPLKLIFWCNLEFAFNLSSFYIHQLPHTIEIDLMEKSINALLNSNLRVIIPDFGAFIIRQNEPRIIVFNEFLRYNDGLLIEYIARTEGFETDIARNMVADYAVEVTKVLDSGKPYTIKGLGTLQKDSAGKIVFDFERTSKQTDTDEKSETEHPTPSVDEVKPPSKTKSRRTAKSTARPEKEILAPVEATESLDVPGTGADDIRENPAEETIPVPTPELISLDDQAVSSEEIPVRKEDQPVPSPEPVSSETKSSPVTVPLESTIVPEKPTANRINLILKWIILILFANAAILAWFTFGDNIRGVFRGKSEPAGMMDSIFERLSDSVRAAATDTTLIFKEVTGSITAGDSLAKGEDLRYYIVAGCFRDEVNADELVKTLKNKGFNAEKFGKIGNLYAVCFASFDDKEMAVKELKHIREEIHPEAWMTRF